MPHSPRAPRPSIGPTRRRALRLPALLLLPALLAGCELPTRASAPSDQPAATSLARAGDHAGAAAAWEAAAAGARGNERQALMLAAAEAWREAGDDARARAAYATIEPRRFDDAQRLRHALLGAGFALADGDAMGAVAQLSAAPRSGDAALDARALSLRADALEAGGDRFGAAAARAAAGEGEAAAGARRIEALLSRLPDRELAERSAALPVGDPLYPFAGRALTRRGLALPRPYDRPASAPADPSLPRADADGYRPPARVALLLPLSGPLANAGNAVRDGFFAGYYGEPRRRPEVRAYDTAALGAEAAYAQAVADGAQRVVGPLEREAVDALFGAPTPVPVLALNRTGTEPPAGSQAWSLSPEDEGVAAAERLLARGQRRVVIAAATDDTARRSAEAFRERIRQRDGEIVAEIDLPEGGLDYVTPLHAAVGEREVDALFLAARAPAARLLKPQLAALSNFDGVPVVATSLVLAGGGDPRQDRELDGVEYPELPWMLDGREGLPDPAAVGREVASSRGAATRLFAFGHDAWLLVAWADHLGADPEASVRGTTGELRLDGFGLVQRRPAWAVFSGGRSQRAPDGGLIAEPAAPAAPSGAPPAAR